MSMSKTATANKEGTAMTTQDPKKFMEDVKVFEGLLQDEISDWKLKFKGRSTKEFSPSFEIIRDLKTFVRESDYVLHVRN